MLQVPVSYEFMLHVRFCLTMTTLSKTLTDKFLVTVLF
jgi:hypothetical protein